MIQRFRDIESDLKKIIANTPTHGTKAEYEKRLIVAITALFADLYKVSKKWVETNLTKTYNKRFDELINSIAVEFKGKGATAPKVGFDKQDERTITALTDELNSDLTNVIDYATNQVNSLIKQGKLSNDEAQKKLLVLLANNGIIGIRSSNGRQIPLSVYATMAVTSIFATLENSCVVNYCDKIENDLVRVSQHVGACQICVPYEGRIYSRSGKDKRFPALYDTPWDSYYQTFHPNCRHWLTPYFEGLQTASKLKEDIAYSNRSFEVGGDGWTKKQTRTALRNLEAYREGQRVKRTLYTDKRQYERYKAVLGDKAPKTFSGFRRSKNSDSEGWQELKKEYRNAVKA